MGKYIQLISRVIKVLGILLILGAAYWCYQHFDVIKEKFYSNFVPHQTVWADTPVVESIREMSQLVTASYYEENVEVRSKNRPLLPLSKEELVMIYKVTIEAGFDLSKLADEDIELRGDTAITIQLPAPGILTRKCNPSDQIVFHDSNSWSEAEMAKMYQKAIDEVEHNAKREGLMTNAIINGREYMTLLLCSFGFKEEHVHVHIRN